MALCVKVGDYQGHSSKSGDEDNPHPVADHREVCQGSQQGQRPATTSEVSHEKYPNQWPTPEPVGGRVIHRENDQGKEH